MTLKTLATLILLPVYLFGQNANKNILRLPIKIEKGFGPFTGSLSGVGLETNDTSDPWMKTNVTVKGIPANWKNVQKGMIWLDAYQFVYQNHLAGNIPLSLYEELQQGWQWIPDKEKLSPKAIKCFVYVARGEDEQGKEWTMVDANNDLDFSNEKSFDAVEFVPGKSIDSLGGNPIIVQYEKLYKGKVVQAQIPLMVAKMRTMLLYAIPQYAVAIFNGAGGKKELIVQSSEPGFSHSKIALMHDSLLLKKVSQDLLISKGEYILIDEVAYKSLGVDIVQGVLELEKIELNYQSLHSTQLNFKAIPFEGKEFTSKEVISLDKYKGKFVFIDFWATWCGPCVREIPNIRKAFEKLHKQKIEILGIVGEDTGESLIKMMEKERIIWPQILSDETNKIVEAYRINGYPTSFLLNPEGVIIAKNLRGEDLYEKISALMIKK